MLVPFRACSNFRDLGVIRGAYGYTKFPMIPVSDGAGEVVAIGGGVNSVRVGERVAGTFPELVQRPHPGERLEELAGRHVDGMLAEIRALPEEGVIEKMPGHSRLRRRRPCRSPGSRPGASLRMGARPHQGRRNSGRARHRRGLLLRHAIVQAARRSCHANFGQRREARPRQGLGADDTNQLSAKIPEWDNEVLQLTDGSAPIICRGRRGRAPGKIDRSAIRPWAAHLSDRLPCRVKVRIDPASHQPQGDHVPRNPCRIARDVRRDEPCSFAKRLEASYGPGVLLRGREGRLKRAPDERATFRQDRYPSR